MRTGGDGDCAETVGGPDGFGAPVPVAVGAAILGTVTRGTVTPGTVTFGTVTVETVTRGTLTVGTGGGGTRTVGTLTDGKLTDGRVSARLAPDADARTTAVTVPATSAIIKSRQPGRDPSCI